ncbi:MAG: glutamine--tRNA ligase, partial [Candidatus Thermoplasmatota archaeon]|nr:glutamine--tRNA ligase [Candidatus Thermoplasmatota archaeon]
YQWAVELVKKGAAYVDDMSAEEISKLRGDVTTPGKESPHRNRSIEENLDLFERMRRGEFKDGEKVLRSKIDMAHPNMNMRDPVMYRILHAKHHNTGDKWCIYPMYDWAHGLEDSIEEITHSICTLEFENHRPLYDWFIDQLGIYHPQQIEFARLNLTYTIMSKRMLKELVDEKLVLGWDDPRMPTISGMRRRGYTPEAIRDFCGRIGVAKVNSTISMELLEHCVRDHLNKTSRRLMGVISPLKVTFQNYPEDREEMMEVANNPEDPGAGTRMVPFSRTVYIEKDDFMVDPPKKFHRLYPGSEVRFRNAYLATCTDYRMEGDQVSEVFCKLDMDTRGGDAPDGRKVKGTIHWVSAPHALDAEIRLYDRLFTVEDPAGQGGKSFKEFINPGSLKVLKSSKVEPAIRDFYPGERFQFERLGYFCVDKESTGERIIINRTISLRDTWAKLQQKGGTQ